MTDTQISPMVAKRLEDAATLIASAREHASRLAAKLDPKLGSYNALEPSHVEALILSQVSYLESLTGTMQAAEQEYIEEQGDDIILRGKLAEACIELDRKLRATREHIQESEGPSALQIYGLTDNPPKARSALVSYARNTIELLSAHPYTFVGELGQQLETRTVAVLLNDLLLPFADLVTQMNTEMDELREALQHRNDAIDAWIDTYRGVSHTIEGLCRIAGEHELAEQFKPTSKRVIGSLKD